MKGVTGEKGAFLKDNAQSKRKYDLKIHYWKHSEKTEKLLQSFSY